MKIGSHLAADIFCSDYAIIFGQDLHHKDVLSLYFVTISILLVIPHTSLGQCSFDVGYIYEGSKNGYCQAMVLLSITHILALTITTLMVMELALKWCPFSDDINIVGDMPFSLFCLVDKAIHTGP